MLSKAQEIISQLHDGAFTANISHIYNTQEDVLPFISKIESSINSFKKQFGEYENLSMFSTPSSLKIGENNIQNKEVSILTTIALDLISVVSKNNDSQINIKFSGYKLFYYDKLSNDKLSILLFYIINSFEKIGKKVGGFNAYIESNIPYGFGLNYFSSIGILFCNIINHLFFSNILSPFVIAKISKDAYNHTFKKNCSYSEHAVTSVGGLIKFDGSKNEYEIKRANFNMEQNGYSICIINCNFKNSDQNQNLNQTFEKPISSIFEGFCLENNYIKNTNYYSNIKGDDVDFLFKSLSNNNIYDFIKSIRETSTQNLHSLERERSNFQNINSDILSLMKLCQEILDKNSAWRLSRYKNSLYVQVFLPNKAKNEFVSKINKMSKGDICRCFFTRTVGSVMLID